MAGQNVGVIEYDARINTKNLKSDALDAEKQVNESAERGSKSFVAAMKTATVATTAAFGVMSGLAVKSFADYEQLTGGVETLFKTSSDTVKEYANNAYRTAGLSANQYMETVTSFSASLLQGLGGDTVKAAKIADLAVTDMADNANKMGTNISMIQYAYQGFAKDNFMMLDNLKLGYGGTASEMARLVNDSQVMGKEFKATAENVRDIPFDKLIEAIHVTQTELGITGTTAKEATETISGSWNSLRSAFTNVLTGVEGSGEALADTVTNMMSQLAEKVPQIVGQMVRGLVTAVREAIDDKFGKGAFDIASTLTVLFAAVAVGVTVWKSYIAVQKAVLAMQLALNAAWVANPIGIVVVAVGALTAALAYFFTQTKTGKDVVNSVAQFFTNTFIPAVKGIGTWFVNVGTAVMGAVTTMVTGITNFFNGLVEFFRTWGVTILAVMFLPFSLALGAIIMNWSAISGFFQGIYNSIVATFTPVVEFFGGVFTAAWNGIVAVWGMAAGFFTGLWSGIVATFSAAAGFFGGVFGAAWQAVKNVFAPFAAFFRGLWNNIVGIFGNIGSAVGDAMGGAIKGAINKVLRGATGIINGFVDAINSVVGVINNIPGVKIGRLGRLNVPQLAQGGVVTSPTLAMIGEGRESEAVIPLSKLDAMLSGEGRSVSKHIEIHNIQVSKEVDADRLLRRMADDQEMTSFGIVAPRKALV